MRFFCLSSLIGLVFMLSACDGTVDASCPEQEENGHRVICNLQAPEDIEILPDQQRLILSHFGGLTSSSPGSLSLFDPRDESSRTLYPSTSSPATPNSLAERWGDADCQTAPGAAFSPHGIHLSQRGDGRWQLLVVNHGGRESVEFFEWDSNKDSLHWRGCAQLPDGSYLNDVVASPEGGFLVSHMFKKHDYLALARTLLGAELGHVWYWRRGQMVSVLPGSTGAFPNGLQISADGKYLFENLYTASTVRKIDRRSGTILGSAIIPHPDNSYWMPDGRLLVASHPLDSFLPTLCNRVDAGYCPSLFQLVALNPETMETEVLLEQKGAPFGAGTIAVELEGKWYLGSYAGNRLMITPAKY